MAYANGTSEKHNKKGKALNQGQYEHICSISNTLRYFIYRYDTTRFSSPRNGLFLIKLKKDETKIRQAGGLNFQR